MSDATSSIQLSRKPPSIDPGDPLDTHSIPAGSEAPCGHSACNSAVALFVKLERMARSEIPAERRIRLLRAVQPQVFRVASEMSNPKVSARGQDTKAVGGQTLEQRLYRLMINNLKTTIEGLDRSPMAFARSAAEERRWLVKNLFLFIGRQIEYGLLWDRPWPEHTWQELHDLFLYLSSRKDIALGMESEEAAETFKPENEYKRLLLLGLLGHLVPFRHRPSLPDRRMMSWAEQTRLQDPGAFGGTFGLFVVDVARDEPPTRHSGVLDPRFSGWVLAPAQEFLDEVGGSARNEVSETRREGRLGPNS
ncbi:MAG: hypothetical protein U9Q81_18475 [Pseudomonadota bacterium]|nr:hypothetical protein [Pseudomonadota bacterium]